jgi:predicted helicase
MYDMYSRAYRWATDRLNENGILAFITNSSFIDSKTFDGFRKTAEKEFSDIYVIDLGGNVRKNPKLSGTRHNVFGIQVGVAITFLIKKKTELKEECNISYYRRPEAETKEEKLEFLATTSFRDISFTHISPDKNGNWINLTDNDFETFIPIANKQTKLTKKKNEENALFKLFSLGVVTNRDDWVYDLNKNDLETKIKFFYHIYESEKKRWNKSNKNIQSNDFVDRTIKWTEELESHLKKGSELKFRTDKIRTVNYRPFMKTLGYVDKIIIHRIYQNDKIWGLDNNFENKVICMTIHPQVNLLFFSSNSVVDQGFGSRASSILPFYRYDEEGNRIENITDWGLEQFRNYYDPSRLTPPSPKLGEGIERLARRPFGGVGSEAMRGKKTPQITKQDIFHYVYAVLHNPAYRKKYEQNLKREFPRIPFYEDFWWWARRGEQLMELHLNYETITPARLKRVDDKNEMSFRRSATTEKSKRSLTAFEMTNKQPKPLLKADKDSGVIYIDEQTKLENIPKEVWQYKLGNRSAVEWVLDQYKEKKIKDPTVRAKFNTYKFADYKEEVIELLKKVCKVSVETVKIIEEMKEKDKIVKII